MKKILLIFVFALLLVGCSKDPLEGSWFDETTNQMITFEDGNKASFSGQDVDYRVDEDQLIFIVDGEEQVMIFDIEDNILELSFPDLDDFELYFKKIIKNN